MHECLYGHYNVASVRVSVASPGLEGRQILGKRLLYESGNMFARENIQVFLFTVNPALIFYFKFWSSSFSLGSSWLNTRYIGPIIIVPFNYSSSTSLAPGQIESF